MDSLETIRGALDGLSRHLSLEAEDPPTVLDRDMLRDAAALEDGACKGFPLALAKRAVGLRLALKDLWRQPGWDYMAAALRALDRFARALEAELTGVSDGRAWSLARRLSSVAENLDKPGRSEYPAFYRLPEMLSASSWVRRELAAADAPLPAGLRECCFRRDVARRWADRTSRTPAGALLSRLESLRNDVEFRARQVWYYRQAGADEPSTPTIYLWAHRDLFPAFRSGLTAGAMRLEVGRLHELALRLHLGDVAMTLESPEWIAQYAMNYLMPPAPDDWKVESAADVSPLLEGRLSRWRLHSFAHRLTPLEMAATALRARRPLFYERPLAHAWLENALLQSFAVPAPAGPAHFELLPALEREFLALFDAYLLRREHYPRLRSPEGWLGYLESLFALHYRSEVSTQLVETRTEFLHLRGLRNPIGLLYWGRKGQGPIQ